MSRTGCFSAEKTAFESTIDRSTSVCFEIVKLRLGPGVSSGMVVTPCCSRSSSWTSEKIDSQSKDNGPVIAPDRTIVWAAGGDAIIALTAPKECPWMSWRTKPWSASHPEAERRSSTWCSVVMMSSSDSPWPE